VRFDQFQTLTGLNLAGRAGGSLRPAHDPAVVEPHPALRIDLQNAIFDEYLG
jgi:hypothetical protein